VPEVPECRRYGLASHVDITINPKGPTFYLQSYLII
jgi:hypothetical protein